MNKIRALLKHRNNEEGNSFLMYFMLIGIMIGVFGFAVDTSINVYTRNAVQGALDTATRAAAQEVYVGGNGRVVLDQNRARERAISIYTKNRPGTGTSGGAFLVCQNRQETGCWRMDQFRISTDARTGQQFVQMRVIERRNNLFLTMVGVDQQTFNVASRARLGTNLESG